MVQSNYNDTSSNFFVEQKCCLVKHADMSWPLLWQQPWNNFCIRYKWHWRFKSSGILSFDCLTLKVKATHSFDLSVATYQSKESNIYLQTCIFINTATTPQILQITLLILTLYMLRIAPMQHICSEWMFCNCCWLSSIPTKTKWHATLTICELYFPQ